MAFLGPYLAACLLLVAAGVAKLRDPGDLAVAARRALRIGSGTVRVLAAGEAILGVVGFLRPSPVPATLVAASYLAFAVYVAWLRRHGGPVATCGCFGGADTAPTRSHIAVDLGLAAAAAGVAGSSLRGWLPFLGAEQPGGGWPLVLTAVVLAGLAYGVLSPLARVEGARRLYAEVS